MLHQFKSHVFISLIRLQISTVVRVSVFFVSTPWYAVDCDFRHLVTSVALQRLQLQR